MKIVLVVVLEEKHGSWRRRGGMKNCEEIEHRPETVPLERRLLGDIQNFSELLSQPDGDPAVASLAAVFQESPGRGGAKVKS
jgi:hypothetical protein